MNAAVKTHLPLTTVLLGWSLALGSAACFATPPSGDVKVGLDRAAASLSGATAAGGQLSVYLKDGEVLQGDYRLMAANEGRSDKAFSAELTGTRGTQARCEGFLEQGPTRQACSLPARAAFKNNGPACRTKLVGSCRTDGGAMFAMEF